MGGGFSFWCGGGGEVDVLPFSHTRGKKSKEGGRGRTGVIFDRDPGEKKGGGKGERGSQTARGAGAEFAEGKSNLLGG